MNHHKRKRNIYLTFIIIVVLLITAYVGSYINFRFHHIEVWERDNQKYVIFPKDSLNLYYLYRPLSYMDAKLTGMRFHIGPHREE
jgi:hypothetical protein